MKSKNPILISIIAVTTASRNRIEKISDTQYKVWVTAVPEKGRANKEIIMLLAKELHVRKSQIEIVRGETRSKKIIQIIY